jgi:hypothetical protein
MTLLQKHLLTTKDTKVTKFFEFFAPNFKILNCALQNSFVYFVSFVVNDLFAVEAQITW